MATALLATATTAPTVTAQVVTSWEVDTHCPGAITWSGEPMLVDAIDAALRSGPLEELPASDCAGAEITVEAIGEGVRFQMQRDGQTAEHVSENPAAVAAWVESWLMPIAFAPERTASSEATTLNAASAEQSAAMGAAMLVALEAVAEDEQPPAIEAEAARAPWRTLVRLDALFTADADATAPLWWGGELQVGIEPRNRLWFSLSGAYQIAPELNAEERKSARFSLRSGWTRHDRGTQVRLGLGFGVSIAHAERETAMGIASDEQALPHVEVYWDLRYHIARGIGVVVGIVLRGIIPDGFDDRAPDPEDTPDEQFEPYPDARASLSVRFGLSWGMQP